MNLVFSRVKILIEICLCYTRSTTSNDENAYLKLTESIQNGILSLYLALSNYLVNILANFLEIEEAEWNRMK